MQWIVAGIGINFDSDISKFPEEVKERASSLFDTGKAAITKTCMHGKMLHERYYEIDTKDLSDENTIELIMKAHSMITRENSPIENVVIDLSCNHGGAADTAAFLLALRDGWTFLDRKGHFIIDMKRRWI